MMPRRTLVAGAAGFVGSHLLPALTAAFPNVVIASSAFDLMEGLFLVSSGDR
jgi:nucleoside-diphosphate-sugar epimerase